MLFKCYWSCCLKADILNVTVLVANYSIYSLAILMHFLAKCRHTFFMLERSPSTVTSPQFALSPLGPLTPLLCEDQCGGKVRESSAKASWASHGDVVT